jgi:hypothetical protein
MASPITIVVDISTLPITSYSHFDLVQKVASAQYGFAEVIASLNTDLPKLLLRPKRLRQRFDVLHKASVKFSLRSKRLHRRFRFA